MSHYSSCLQVRLFLVKFGLNFNQATDLMPSFRFTPVPVFKTRGERSLSHCVNSVQQALNSDARINYSGQLLPFRFSKFSVNIPTCRRNRAATGLMLFWKLRASPVINRAGVSFGGLFVLVAWNLRRTFRTVCAWICTTEIRVYAGRSGGNSDSSW